MLEEETVLDVLEENETQKKEGVDEEKYANLLTSFTDEEFLVTTQILVGLTKKN